MFNGERTIYNLKLQNRMMHGLPYVTLLNTTLNESLGILHSTDVTDIPYPSLNLLVIGNGGSRETTSTRLNLMKSPHSVVNTVLNNQVPLYLRKTSDMIVYPPSDKCRLKKTLLINNIEYTAFYGYKIENYDYTNDIVTFKDIDERYVNVSELQLNTDLTIKQSENIDLTLPDKEYIADFVKIYTFFTMEEIAEIMNAMLTLNPDSDLMLTEIGLCTSKEYVTEELTENVKTQIGYFIDVSEDLQECYKEGKLDFTIETGGMEILVV